MDDQQKRWNRSSWPRSWPRSANAVAALAVILTLVGCQHAKVMHHVWRPSALSALSEPIFAPSSIAKGADRAIDNDLAQAGGDTSREERPGEAQSSKSDEVITVAAETVFSDSPSNPPVEPELLPPPEKVTDWMPSSPHVDVPAGAFTLTLQQALSTALAQNPDLVTLRGQVNVNRAMVGVAETPIWNPFVQAQLLPQGSPHIAGTGPGTGAGKTNYYIWAMQRFEVAHQRRYRTESALAALSQVQWNIFHAELLNVSQSSAHYFTALYQKELYDLTAANLELNNHLLGVMERRQQAGLAAPNDVATARIATRQSQRQMDLAEANYQSAMLALQQQLNLPINTPLVLTERLADLHWLPIHAEGQFTDQACQAAELIEGRPDVMAARVGIQVAQANWMLASAARIPDIQAGPIFDTSDAGTSFLGLRLQMDLPVRNNGSALQRQRCAEMSQQSLTYDQLRIKATKQAHAAILQYERIRTMAASSDADKSRSRAELEEVLRLFDAGQADMLAVIATQNNLLQERRIDLDVLNQLGQSAAIVIQATGLPIDYIIAPCVPTPTPVNTPTEG